jgi:hypothetical protein
MRGKVPGGSSAGAIAQASRQGKNRGRVVELPFPPPDFLSDHIIFSGKTEALKNVYHSHDRHHRLAFGITTATDRCHGADGGNAYSRLREHELRAAPVRPGSERRAEEFLMKRLAAVLLALFFAVPALAQVPPYVYPITLGASQSSILPVNTNRKKLIFQNPNATALVAVCPAGPARTGGATVTAAINGPGCLTMLPYQSIEISGSTSPGPQYDQMPSAWIGIASAGGSALTVIEFE